MISKHTREQKIKYLQSLSDRSPEEEAILEKLLSSQPTNIYSAKTVQDYQRQKIRRYYTNKYIQNKIKPTTKSK